MADNRPGLGKTKAKTRHLSSTKNVSSAADKLSSRREKALEKQFGKAKKAALLQASKSTTIQGSLPATNRKSNYLSPDATNPSALPACFEDTFAPFDCFPGLEGTSVSFLKNPSLPHPSRLQQRRSILHCIPAPLSCRRCGTTLLKSFCRAWKLHSKAETSTLRLHLLSR